MTTLIAFIVIFGTIVFVHELGHFTVAKMAGIRVYEFSLGFGPTLGSKKWGETKYSIRALPLGGFVKMAGMDKPETIDDEIEADDPGSFQNKSLAWRIATIAAGPLMNFVFAVVLFAIYFMLVTIPPTITLIEVDSPAEQAGFLPGDQFVAVDDVPVDSTQQIVNLIQAAPDREINVTVKRNTDVLDIPVTPLNKEEKGVIGVGIDSKPQYPFFTSVSAAVTQTGHMTNQLVHDLGQMIVGKQKAEISGPIGIVQIVGQTARHGLPSLLLLAVILNINLGLLNLLPVPVLDGGWIVILAIEAIRGKPLAPEHRGIAQFIGLALLLLLMVFATIKDISRLNLFS
ncbi:MAG: RIP metalloprotease RseP [Firmicutes bacterium]|jgi:regulator of sigma E protease|nr:RIP metalloprotease RseP [Bacillota bacterium]